VSCRRRPARVATVLSAAALCCMLAGGCGSAAEAPSLRLDASQPGEPVRDAGLLVLRFVQAARRGDAAQMWALLSRPTRLSIGPTLAAFARGTAPELAKDVEDFRGGRVLLSRRLDDVWAVGAVSGRYVQDGESEPAGYAAALRREEGTWRIELGGLVIARLRPEPLDRTGDRPAFRAEAQAGAQIERMLLWLDGGATSVGRSWTSPFSAELRGRPRSGLASGEHVVVVFASTEDTAAALAWTFEVDD
jgi:hypothetical protein